MYWWSQKLNNEIIYYVQTWSIIWRNHQSICADIWWYTVSNTNDLIKCNSHSRMSSIYGSCNSERAVSIYGSGNCYRVSCNCFHVAPSITIVALFPMNLLHTLNSQSHRSINRSYELACSVLPPWFYLHW